MNKKLLAGLLAAQFFLWGCGNQPSGTTEGSGKKNIVCTTGMIADAVSEVAGDQATVSALMGPGVDPHLYKATQGDLRALTRADLVFYNGLHLEGKMGEVLEKLGRQKPVIALGESLDESLLINSSAYASAFDPHIWFDVSLWARIVDQIAAVMAETDPAHAETYRQNASAYRSRLEALHLEVKETIANIPERQRVLITAHDAFEYFGQAYGIEVRGLQGISTVSEYGLKDVTDMVDFIVDRGIKAVFVESSVPQKSLEAVVEGCARRGHAVRIGGTLFSDAMGEAGTPEGTYPGMVQYNVKTIVEALK